MSDQPVDYRVSNLTLSSPSFHTRFRFLNAVRMISCVWVCVYGRVPPSFFRIRCSRTWDWQLALTLQEGGVGVDELVGGDIADGDAGHDDCGIDGGGGGGGGGGSGGSEVGVEAGLSIEPLRGVHDINLVENRTQNL